MATQRSSWTFAQGPLLPPGPATSVDDLSLSACRDLFTHQAPDSETKNSLQQILADWRDDPERTMPILAMRGVLESVRRMPPGDHRIACMNTIVRTLGEAEALANVLDMLRHAEQRAGSEDQALARVAQNGSMHCLYGWCGQTALLQSHSHPTEGTLPAPPDAQERLGYPPPTWSLTIHIWQPNPKAKGFPSRKRAEPDLIVEPPHSHPFDFVSMMSTGTMRQSTYRQGDADSVRPGSRYDGVSLEHVDGIWPPHCERIPSWLTPVESGVDLDQGDSYYMPCDRIHDVEVEWDVAVSRPAITLFMASETRVIPHCYMARSMAEFHEANPDVREAAVPLTVERWRAKLAAVSAYLRKETDGLNLDEIVAYDGEYAFFHS